MGIIVIHQLPATPATLWFRLLGKGNVQAQAIREVATLPLDSPYRSNALELFGNLRVTLEARQKINSEEQELIMQLSPLSLEKIQAAEQRGEQRGVIRGQQELVLRLLNRRVGGVSSDLELQIKALPLAQLEDLGEALLDFSRMSDLVAWLNVDRSR